MKKFISGLSSLVLAATAMGGALAFSADAATNGKVDSTIVSIKSDGKNEVKVEKGGVSIPVAIYIPQSSGFYEMDLKLAVNGDATLGQGKIQDKNGDKVQFDYAFGNYGITLSDDSWTAEEPMCLESGAYDGDGYAEGSSFNAGYYNNGGVSVPMTDMFRFYYLAKNALMYQPDSSNTKRTAGPHNVDSYDAWLKAGEPDDLTDYTPVETWTADEGYETPFISFKLNLPADLEDGTYVLDVYTDEYVHCTPSTLFDADNKLKSEDKWVKMSSHAYGAEGGKEKITQTLKSEALTIVVGDAAPGTTTTKAPDTTKASTTTTADPGAVVPTDDKIIYNLVPAGKDYTPVADGASGNNTMNAEPGEEITVNWTVKNDLGTAGLQMTFGFDGVEFVSASAGGAYKGSPQVNKENTATTGELNYAFATSNVKAAADDAIIYKFKVKAPESGSGTVSIKTGDGINNKVVPLEDGKKYDYIFHGLTINVDKDDTTTTKAPDTTTTASETTTTKAPETTTTKAPETTTTVKPDGDVLPGDVNCNGKVQINDVVLLNRYLAKTAEVSEQGLKNAECDGDGKISQNDATAIKEYLARLITALPKK